MSIRRASPLFGKINVYEPKDGNQRVEIYIRIDQRVEGMEVGIAIDASSSMQPSFSSYIPKIFRQPGQNIIETVVRDLARFLCVRSNDGCIKIIYWAVGSTGREIEILKDIMPDNIALIEFEGPQIKSWGGGTYLLPALNYFAEEYKHAKWMFLLIITDGELQDFEEIKQRSIELIQEIADGKRQHCKFIIIGVGPEINREQLEELDHLSELLSFKRPISDLWDSKIAKEMKEIVEIMDEVDFGVIIPGKIKINDDKGNEVLTYSDGFPQRLEFYITEGTTSVTVQIAGQQIYQSLEETEGDILKIEEMRGMYFDNFVNEMPEIDLKNEATLINDETKKTELITKKEVTNFAKDSILKIQLKWRMILSKIIQYFSGSGSI